MKRREFLKRGLAFGPVTAIPFSIVDEVSGWWRQGEPPGQASLPVTNPLTPPESGSIPVAFVLSKDVVVIDFAPPWEVFQKTKVHGDSRAFRPYTVAESTKPFDVQFGGMKILPEYTFDNAPAAKVIVIPAQAGGNHAMLNWIRKSAKDADVTMSVCVGAFILAKTALLSGKPATTHHLAYDGFAKSFRDVQLQRGVRFVDSGKVASACGLTSGIDLALHVVERYFGRETARQTASYLEYQGEGWLNPNSNGVYK